MTTCPPARSHPSRCKDLDEGIDFVHESTGVRPAIAEPSGAARATLSSRSASAAISKIIAPDPAQSEIVHYRNFAPMTDPSLIGWAVHLRTSPRRQATRAKIKSLSPARTTVPKTPRMAASFNWKTITSLTTVTASSPFFIEWSADSSTPPRMHLKCTLTILKF